MSLTIKPQSIYIHLPFCKTKCPYCDFASFANQDEKRTAYIDALLREIELRSQEFNTNKHEIDTIFFGGGTPSVHSAEEIKSIIDKLKQYFNWTNKAEISMEVNPGTVSAEKLKAFIDIGINRISFGAQTFDAKLLEKLGRGHSVEDSYTLLEILKQQPVTWSFDLIYGLPGQTLSSWAQTLDMAMSYQPPHISAYALSIETNTPYGAIYKSSAHPDLPPEDSVVEMYDLTHKVLLENGLYRYEISNWSKAGHEARHNITYWKALEYYAFGLSAHGYVNSVRYANTRNLDEYIAMLNAGNLGQLASKQLLTDAEKLEEKIMLNLRLDSGLIITDAVKSRINLAKLKSLNESGFIEIEDQRIKLTDKAIMLSNKVIAELL